MQDQIQEGGQRMRDPRRSWTCWLSQCRRMIIRGSIYKEIGQGEKDGDGELEYRTWKRMRGGRNK